MRKEARANTLIETNEEDGFLIIINDRIADCSTGFLRIFGCSCEREVIGRKFYDLAPIFQPNGRESFELYKEIIDELYIKGKSKSDFLLQNSQGKGFCFEMLFSYKYVEGKKVIGVAARKTQEQKSAKMPESIGTGIYDSIFNNSHTPMLIIDSDNGSIVDGNLAACNYYGYDMKQLLQLNIADINILSGQELYKEMREAKKENRKYFRFKHRKACGEVRDVEVYSGPLSSDYGPLLFSIVHDVQDKTEMEQKIELQESYFKGLYENSPEAIAVLDNEFGIININRSFTRIFQYCIDEVKQQNLTKILCSEEFYDESTYFKDCITRGKFVREETLRRRKDGTLVNVSLLGYPIVSRGEQIGVYVIYSDLSSMKEIESKKRLFSEIFKNNTVGVVITDVNGSIQWVNEAFTVITGYSAEETEGKNPRMFKSGKHDPEYYGNMWNAILNDGKWQGEISNIRKDGELYQGWLSILAVMDDNGNIEHFVGMLNDITDVRQKEDKIEILTSKDSLTELYNRDYFINRLNHEIARRSKGIDGNQQLVIIFLDLDDFKEINDTLGHLAGDVVLKEFASRLKGSIREFDIPARFGGDEFIVMLPNVKEHYEIIHIANRILEETRKPFVVEGTEIRLNASIGIARYPDDGSDSTILIRNADIAMYRSKDSKSKKITMFEPALDEEVRQYFKIKNNLRNALENKEFFLEYQPIIDVARNQVVGAEALLRWNFNGSEIMSPLKFIPMAEKNGSIQAIGEWVLNEACRQNAAWQAIGNEPVYVSVNVSIIQLEQPNFCKVVEKALENSRLTPEYLQLEITETIFTKNYDKLVETINEINKLGIKIAIDDFGTGYSSLGQLSRLDIAKLKIDKSFVGEINQNENKNKIIKAIISLAKSLNLELTAEGVETREQLDFLANNGCNMVQGYLYSKPLDAVSFENFLGGSM